MYKAGMLEELSADKDYRPLSDDEVYDDDAPAASLAELESSGTTVRRVEA